MTDAESTTPSLEDQKFALEKQKFDSDTQLRKRELDIKARENGWAARLFSPMMAAVLALAGSAVGALIQAQNTLTLENAKFDFNKQLETQKEEHELILKMVSVAEIDQAKQNIQFLAETGLITNKELAKKILESKTTPRIPPQNASPLVLSAPSGCDIAVDPGSTLDQAMADWAKTNVTAVTVPQLAGVAGAPPDGKVLFNVDAADALKSAWADVEQAGLLDRVISWDGSYAARLMRGSANRVSPHACGLAFDINAQFNFTGMKPKEKGVRGSVAELVPIFEKRGFMWGGNDRIPDGMHFEYVLPETPKVIPMAGDK